MKFGAIEGEACESVDVVFGGGEVEENMLVFREVGVDGDAEESAFASEFALFVLDSELVDGGNFLGFWVDGFDVAGSFDDEEGAVGGLVELHGVVESFGDGFDPKVFVSRQGDSLSEECGDEERGESSANHGLILLF